MEYMFRGQPVYYELHGQGSDTLLLLNGILMSTASWAPFVQAFTSGGKRLLLVDLMDQGRSAARESGYTIHDQADMIAGLIESLKLEKAGVMGTSYGGAVALSLTIRYPDRVGRLMLAGTRAYTDPLFHGMCESWLHASTSPAAMYTATMPLFYGAGFQEREAEWLAARRGLLERTAFSNPGFQARFRRLVESIMGFDVREQLGGIKAPTLVLSAADDLVMMPWEQQRIAQGIKGARLVTLHNTGHVMFLENPEAFIPIMMGWFHFTGSISLP